MKLSHYLTEFLEHLEIEKNRSQKTIQNYDFYLRRFLGWLGDKKPDAIEAEAVRKYRLWLNRLADVHGSPLKKNTQNYHLIALRSLLKYLAKRDIATLAPEKIELMRMPDREVSFLEGSDLNRLLEAPLGEQKNTKTRKHENTLAHQSLIKYRDKALLELLFSTGLRVSELAQLKRESVNLQKDEFTVTGKGGRSRVVFVSEQARYWLRKYLGTRTDFNPFLLISHDQRNKKTRKHLPAMLRPPATLRVAMRAGIALQAGENTKTSDGVEQPLTPRSIQRLVQKYARAAGITKPVTPHTLRHSYATDLLQNGADIRSVQALLGHSSITTTQIYTHITDKELRNIHKKFHGQRRND